MMTLMMCLMTSIVFGQWTDETVNSEFDGSFKIAYTETINSKSDGYLIMEVGEPTYNGTIKINRPFLALRSYHRFSDRSACIDFILVVNGVDKKYKLIGYRSSDDRTYYFDESIWTDEFIKDFKSASKCYIRVNQNDHYRFDFSGSAEAFDYITK